MTISNTFRTALLGTALLAMLFAAGAATAKKARPVMDDAVEIDRPVDDLPTDLRPVPEDPDRIETVLIFTNPGRHPVNVRCVAFNRAGEALGRVQTRVPATGLRHILGEDVSEGVAYIGQVQCAASGPLVPSAVLVGLAVENLNVKGNGASRRIVFPLVISD